MMQTQDVGPVVLSRMYIETAFTHPHPSSRQSWTLPLNWRNPSWQRFQRSAGPIVRFCTVARDPTLPRRTCLGASTRSLMRLHCFSYSKHQRLHVDVYAALLLALYGGGVQLRSSVESP